MKFKQATPYPIWNPDATSNIPGIPDWTRNFGKNIVSFDRGSKPCYVNAKNKNKKNIQCGDYLILVSIPSEGLKEHQITDSQFITIIKKNTIIDIEKLHNIASRFCKNVTIEEKVVEALISNTLLSDLCRTFIYYSWHRCIIEDRIYQQPYYGGQRTYLNIIK